MEQAADSDYDDERIKKGKQAKKKEKRTHRKQAYYVKEKTEQHETQMVNYLTTV
jgi:hypothetical protein